MRAHKPLDDEACVARAQGQVFAVGVHSGVIKLFDPRNYTSGPFATFTVRVRCPSPSQRGPRGALAHPVP